MTARSVEFEDTEQLDSDFFTEPEMAAEENAMIQLNSDLGAEIDSVDPPGYNRSIVPTEAAFLQAKIFIADAIHDRDENHKLDILSLKLYRLHRNIVSRYLIYLLIFIEMVVLPSLEYPQVGWIKQLGVPLWVPVVIELVIIGFYWVNLFIESVYLVRWEVIRKPRVWILCTVLMLITIEDVLFLILCFGFHINCKFQRLTAILQPIIMICHVKPVRYTISSMTKMPRVLELIFLIFLSIFVCTFFLYFMFARSDQGDVYFYNLWQTGLQLYILVTTTNYPDVMMPAYTDDSWTSVLFIAFLIIMTFVFMKVTLALIYNIYTKNVKYRLKRLMLLERKRLLMAFAALDPAENGYLPYDVFDQLITYFKPTYSARKKRVYFRLLDTARNGFLNPEEFCALLDVSRVKFWSEFKRETSGPFLKRLRKMTIKTMVQKILDSRAFDIFVALVIMADCALILAIYETSSDKHDCSHLVSVYQGAFLAFYTLEMIVRFLFRVSLKKFFSDLFVLFELALFTVCYIAFLYSWIEGTRCHGTWERILFFSPLLRLFRVMRVSRLLLRLARSLEKILPTIMVFVTIEFFVVFYEYAVIGTLIWAGRIDRDNVDIQQSAYGLSNYYKINFDDFWRALVTVYDMMVINNWHIIASGFVALDGQAAWIYFISFNVINYMVMLNVVISAIVESMQVAFATDKEDTSKVSLILSEWNKMHGGNVDYVWKSKSKTQHRNGLEKAYGSEDGIKYIAEKLGTVEEGLEKMRNEYHRLLKLSNPVLVSMSSSARDTSLDYPSDARRRRSLVDRRSLADGEYEMDDLSAFTRLPDYDPDSHTGSDADADSEYYFSSDYDDDDDDDSETSSLLDS